MPSKSLLFSLSIAFSCTKFLLRWPTNNQQMKACIFYGWNKIYWFCSESGTFVKFRCGLENNSNKLNFTCCNFLPLWSIRFFGASNKFTKNEVVQRAQWRLDCFNNDLHKLKESHSVVVIFRTRLMCVVSLRAWNGIALNIVWTGEIGFKENTTMAFNKMKGKSRHKQKSSHFFLYCAHLSWWKTHFVWTRPIRFNVR